MGCTTRKMNTPSAKLDEEQHIQRLKAYRFYSEEICGQHLVGILTEEGAPAISTPGSSVGRRDMLPFEQVPNSRAADGGAEFEQFTLNLAVTPTSGSRWPIAQSTL